MPDNDVTSDTGLLQQAAEVWRESEGVKPKLLILMLTPLFLFLEFLMFTPSYSCPSCGTELVGSGHNCPECGHAFTERGELRNLRKEVEKLNDSR